MSISISGSGAITGASTSYSFDQAVSIAGTVTYEDVSNVDSVGIITAQSGIHVTGGSVGIGTDNAGQKLHVSGGTGTNIQVQQSNGNLFLGSSGSTRFGLASGANIIQSAAADFGIGSQSGHNLILGTNNAERLRITSGGIIKCGTSSVLKAEINNAVSGHQFISQCSDNNNGFEVYQQHGSNTTRNTFAVYANTGSSNAKNLQFAVRGDGKVGIGTDAPNQPLHVHASGTSYVRFTDESSGTGASDGVVIGLDHPHTYVWNYEAGNFVVATNATERLRIDSSGRVGINTTGFADSATALNIKNGAAGSEHTFLDIECNANESCRVRFSEDGSTYPGEIRYDQSQNSMDFFVNSAESMSIDSTNNIYMGDPADYGNGNYGQTSGNGNFLFRRDTGSTGGAVILTTDSDNGWANMYLNRFDWNTSDDSRFINFFKNGSSISSIELNAGGTQVVYNTGSDYRLKENVVSLTGAIDRIKQLQPKSFNLIEDSENNPLDGFLAHEASTVVPYAVTGTKDGMKVDESGNTVPDMQGMDYGKLTPLLTAALQEAITKIETLEQRLTDAGL